MPQNFPKISHGTPCNTSSSPATSIRSIHSPIMTLLALEKGQLVSADGDISGWKRLKVKANWTASWRVQLISSACSCSEQIKEVQKKRKGERSGNWTWRQTRFCFVHWIYAANEGNVLLCLPNCITDISDLPLQVVKSISSKLSSTLLLSKSR